jgi:hypothetical protein
MKRTCAIVLWVLTATMICSAQTKFYFPHVANGVLTPDVWKTTIFLTNPAASGTASGTITLTKENSTKSAAGAQFAEVSFTDQDGAAAGSGGIITFSIPAGQTRKYTSSGTGEYKGGFATVSTTVGTVTGTAIFSKFDLTGRLIAEAGVPSASSVANQAIFVDTIGDFNIGVAYANPETSSAVVELSLLNSSAATVATTTETVGPGNHVAAFTFQMFPGAPQLAGTMQLRAPGPLVAIALRFDPALNVFTTLPPVTLSALVNPVMRWMDQRPWLQPLSSIARILGTFYLSMA